MKVLAFDIATSTGWAVVEDSKLIDYGTINMSKKKGLGERLKFLTDETSKLLKQIKPDDICVEDVISVKNAKTIALLARYSGCVISECYNYLNEDIVLYYPKAWKANSFPELCGSSAKWEIQLAVVKHYGLIEDVDLDYINDKISCEIDEQNILKDKIKYLKVEHKKVKRITRKDLDDASNDLYEIDRKLKCKKKKLKEEETKATKELKKLEKFIAKSTGINTDMADAISMAYSRCQEV